MNRARPSVSRARERAFKALTRSKRISATTALSFTVEAPAYLNRAVAREIERWYRKREAV